MKKIIKHIYILIFAILILYPITVFAKFDAPYEAQNITGLSKTYTCKNLDKFISTMDNGKEKEVHEKLLEAQCTAKGKKEKSLFSKYVHTSKRITKYKQFCSLFQRHSIKNYMTEEIDDEAFLEFEKDYIKDCLSFSTTSNPLTDSRYQPITLSAPIPIEGGEQIEASNKSYLFVYMIKLYRFVLTIAGIIAVLELIIAGFQISLSAGDSGKAEEGKKRIVQTLEGLGILFTSAIILNTLNPTGYNFDTDIELIIPETVLVMMNPIRGENLMDPAPQNAEAIAGLKDGIITTAKGKVYGSIFTDVATENVPENILIGISYMETFSTEDGAEAESPHLIVSGDKEKCAGLAQFSRQTAANIKDTTSDRAWFPLTRLTNLDKPEIQCTGTLQSGDLRCEPWHSIKGMQLYLNNLIRYFAKRGKTGKELYLWALTAYNTGPRVTQDIFQTVNKDYETAIAQTEAITQIIQKYYFVSDAASAEQKVTQETQIYAKSVLAFCSEDFPSEPCEPEA